MNVRSTVVGLAGIVALAGPAFADLPSDVAQGFGAVLRASERAVLSAGIDARVVSVAVRPGDAFARGDTLLELDCARQDAAVLRSAARHEFAALDHASNEQLATLDSVSDLQLAESRLRLAEAQAELATSRYSRERCTLVAPFDGVLTERSAEPHEHVAAGQELLRIVSNATLEVEFLAPSEALAALHADGGFTLYLDESEQPIDGRIATVVPSVDAVSRTIKVIGRLSDAAPSQHLWVGMSGWVELHE